MLYRIVFAKQAEKDLKNLKNIDLASKARKLVGIIRENPYQTPPGYEKLVGNLTGAYSRRINIQHRLVYQVIEEPCTIDDIHYEGIVKIIRMWTHYEAGYLIEGEYTHGKITSFLEIYAQ